MAEIHNLKQLEIFRKKLRRNLTPAEAMLWKCLKEGRLGRKFRRQHSVGNYILDFYCATDRLAIELDGSHHSALETVQCDEARTRYLEILNIKVLRFENRRIFHEVEEVMGEIKLGLHHPDHDES